MCFQRRDCSSETGRELWVSDGTDRGTRRVDDLLSGSRGSDPSFLTVFNNQLFFAATTDTSGRELWRTASGLDGVARLVRDARKGPQGLNKLNALVSKLHRPCFFVLLSLSDSTLM